MGFNFDYNIVEKFFVICWLLKLWLMCKKLIVNDAKRSGLPQLDVFKRARLL